MKWLNGYRIRLVLVGSVAAIALGGQSANAESLWGTAVNLGPNVNSSSNDVGPSISADGLTLYFSSNRPGGSGGYDLWYTTRATINDDWGPAVNLGQPPNSQYSYWEPSISSDDLTLYFSDGHSPTFGNRLPDGLGGQGDIWMVTRASVNDVWGEPINLGPAVNSQHAIHPSISSDSLSLYFQSHRPGHLGHCDIMVATRKSMFDPFGDPAFLKKVNSGGPEWTPDISADGLTLFFMRNPGPPEIWASTRRTTDDDFGTPIKLPPQVNMPGYTNGIPHLSADGSTLYFLSDRPGGFGAWDLWQVPITPVVDFNGDEKVDLKDFSRLAQYWGQNKSSVNIAPRPLADGIVDIQDLAVFAEYWLVEFGLVAHWKLDETEGGTAHDSIAGNHAFGPPDLLWRPEGGKAGGALELDGIDDLLFTTFSLNPADTSFSVFAWVKGGAPGQVIISQSGGANWLMADASEGKLVTELKGTGRFDGFLSSQAVIADGDWHRIGITWDGSNRILHVDDVEVAGDTQAGLAGSNGGFYFGAGKNPVRPSLWLGLLDDIRIYDRAVVP